MNHKKAIYIFLTSFLFQTVEADILENFGWQKKVDDFEETTTYIGDHQNYAFRCDGTGAAVFGLINGEIRSKTPLTVAYYFYGSEEIRRDGTLKWKSDDGTKSLEFVCANDYKDGGWYRQCIVPGVTSDIADSLANTDFIRIDFPGLNIDLKEEGSTSGCKSLFAETKRLANEYFQAVNQ